MISGRIDWESVPYCAADDKEKAKASIKHGDLVISRTGANAGAAAYVSHPPEGAVFAGYLVRFRAIPSRADSRYLGYVLRSRLWNEYVENTRTGSAQPQLNAVRMSEFRFPCPSLEEQRRIAGVLGSFDDLIESNERLMSSVDSLASAYFQANWDKESWTTIDSLGKLTMGQSPPGHTYNEVGDGPVFFQGVRDFGMRFPSERVYCSAPTRYAAPGDVLIAVRAPVGQTNVARTVTAIGRGLAALKSESPSSALHAIRASSETWAPFEGTGTVFASINGKDLRSARVPKVEPQNVEGILGTLDAMYNACFEEASDLRRTRDELIPLLISGAVRVSDIGQDRDGGDE
ncbi:restriction endonuclease subunit S [Arthrobacter sp. AQ5-05]|uniref:restriction endonuclease subunit S n=1 Tax=Arthrobacter sp. AQ5-05 TaxID=2184581 RepID=UPI0018A7BF03